MTKQRKEWYEDLIGKEVEWINLLEEKCPGIVTGINYHIGYTIQAARDYGRFEKGDYLTCYRGPSSPVKNYGKAKNSMAHRKHMTAVVKDIRNGIYNAEKLLQTKEAVGVGGIGVGGIGVGPSASTCVFAQ